MNEARYNLTSVKNWEKYEATGDASLLNDIKPEEASAPYKGVLAWEGGAVEVILDINKLIDKIKENF